MTASPLSRPGGLPDAVRKTWDELGSPTAAGARFAPAIVADLPAPVARWLNHAIAPGAPLCRSARLAMHGKIRIGKWRPFEASQILALPRGFIWAATAALPPFRIRGFDWYSDGTGEMRWRVFGAIPVMSASGPDISRSAAGRLAAEAMLVPPAVLAEGVSWRAVDNNRATAGVTIGDIVPNVTVEVDDHGALRAVTLPRWGDPDKGAYREHTFGVIVEDEGAFGDYTMPSRLRAGWWLGSDRWAEGEFFRCTIDHAELF